jgi:hypothetical protein
VDVGQEKAVATVEHAHGLTSDGQGNGLLMCGDAPAVMSREDANNGFHVSGKPGLVKH